MTTVEPIYGQCTATDLKLGDLVRPIYDGETNGRKVARTGYRGTITAIYRDPNNDYYFCDIDWRGDARRDMPKSHLNPADYRRVPYISPRRLRSCENRIRRQGDELAFWVFEYQKVQAELEAWSND